MKNKVLCTISAVISLILLFTVIWPLGQLLMPQRTSFGANWGGFLQQEENTSDVIFFGSSIVYCDAYPEIFTRESGLSAYVLAGPEQNMAMTYYYIKEALNTQSPSIIFVEMTEMFFPEKNSFQKVNIGYMPWSLNRLKATFDTADKEEWLGLLFPIYNYHDRLKEITPDELKQNLEGYTAEKCRGFTYLTDAAPQHEFTEKEVDTNEYDNNLEWFKKIVRLTRANDITLIPYIAPYFNRLSEENTERIRQDAANEGLLLLDCNDYFDEFNFNSERDFYDNLHTNCCGAEKFSRWLGRYTVEFNAAQSSQK